jgi:hypothetical protein
VQLGIDEGMDEGWVLGLSDGWELGLSLGMDEG